MPASCVWWREFQCETVPRWSPWNIRGRRIPSTEGAPYGGCRYVSRRWRSQCKPNVTRARVCCNRGVRWERHKRRPSKNCQLNCSPHDISLRVDGWTMNNRVWWIDGEDEVFSSGALAASGARADPTIRRVESKRWISRPQMLAEIDSHHPSTWMLQSTISADTQ